MPKDKVVVGIDVGSSKVTTVIASILEDTPINIIGVSSIPAKGLRKGQVVYIYESVNFIT